MEQNSNNVRIYKWKYHNYVIFYIKFLPLLSYKTTKSSIKQTLPSVFNTSNNYINLILQKNSIKITRGKLFCFLLYWLTHFISKRFFLLSIFRCSTGQKKSAVCFYTSKAEKWNFLFFIFRWLHNISHTYYMYTRSRHTVIPVDSLTTCEQVETAVTFDL